MKQTYGLWSAALLSGFLIALAGAMCTLYTSKTQLAYIIAGAVAMILVQALLTYNFIQCIDGISLRLVHINPFEKNKTVSFRDIHQVSIIKRTVKGGGTTIQVETIAGHCYEITTVMMGFEYNKLAVYLQRYGVRVSTVKF